ncbi:MAG: 2-thiouracil desulfurase family protein [Saprospiraceae bacterium]|nr:2-thiouracil desulfurase family protein [Saprospiraceae bacterium]
MPDQDYIRNLRIPTSDDPLRVLVSACLVGVKCGVDGDDYGEYASVLKLLNYDNVKLIPFCPEDFSFGTPREMCDIHGGDGFDVLAGKARVLTASGADWSAGMIRASEKMLKIAQENAIELAIMMDVSAACGNHVIYDGNRYAENKKYQIGMGVCGAQLSRAGFKIISWREYASLQILYSRIDPDHILDEAAQDFDQHEWYISYFNKKI